MEREERLTRTFPADDGVGGCYVVHEYTTFTLGSDTGGQEWKPTKWSYRTSEGIQLGYVSKGVYEIVGQTTRLRLISRDPNAP